MKKFLSLVLALVTISAGAADYKDADEITNVEAVDVLSALGVLQGDENGFRPTGTLKRSEAAKIICALNLTPKTAALLSADTAPFADVPASHWAAGYIAEGVKSRILAGVGGGKFAPDAELTGYQFLKMLLVSLGYDAVTEQLTGANWSIAVAKLADELELTKGNDSFVGSKAITREEAALYALNTLQAQIVEYDTKGTQITVGDTTINTGASKAEGVTKKVDGEVVPVTFMDQNYKKLEKETDAVDDLGRAAVTWTYDGEEIGTYAKAADYVLVATKDTTLAKLIDDKDLEKKITTDVPDMNLACGTVVELMVEKKAVTDVVTYQYDLVKVADVETVDEEEDLAKDNGVSEIYDLEVVEGDVELEDTYVDVLTEKKTDYVAIGNFAKKDMLVVKVSEDDKAVSFAKAEIVEGKIDARGTNYVKVDGEKYAFAGATSALNFDDTYTFYLDANDVIISYKVAEEAESDLEFVYVLKADAQDEFDSLVSAKENVAKVKVMYLNGDVEVLDYALSTDKKTDEVSFKVNGTKIAFTKDAFKGAVKAGWYAYTLNDDGEVTLKSADKADKSEVMNVSAVKNDKTVADGIYASTSTKVTVLNKDGIVKTYTGYKNFPSTALEGEALVILNKTAAKEVYVYNKDAKEDAEKIDTALFVSKGDETADGTKATFYVDGEKVTYVVESGLTGAKAGKLYEIELDEDDIATIKPITAADKFTKGNLDVVSDDYVVVDGKEITLTSDVAVYQVSKDGKTVSSAELAADKDAVVILNADGKGTEVFMYKDITILG